MLDIYTYTTSGIVPMLGIEPGPLTRRRKLKEHEFKPSLKILFQMQNSLGKEIN